MTIVRMQHGAKSRPAIFPHWLRLLFLGILLAISITGLLLVNGYVSQKNLRMPAYGLFLVFGATAMGLLLLRLDEWRQLRRWCGWKCPSCSATYELREFSEVHFWGTEAKKKRAGVLLTCAKCGDETAFEETGNVHSST